MPRIGHVQHLIAWEERERTQGKHMDVRTCDGRGFIEGSSWATWRGLTQEARPNPYCLSCSDCTPTYVNILNFGKEVHANYAGEEGTKKEGHNHGKRESAI